MRREHLLTTAFLTIDCAVSAGAAQPGAVCIAPFRVSPLEPRMVQETWPPSADSVFHFQFGKFATADVRAGQAVKVGDLPADRRMRVRISLDGRPFESFWLDLSKERGHRECLWLRPGYWH